jgi:hypothetical protein
LPDKVGSASTCWIPHIWYHTVFSIHWLVSLSSMQSTSSNIYSEKSIDVSKRLAAISLTVLNHDLKTCASAWWFVLCCSFPLIAHLTLVCFIRSAGISFA